MRQVIVGLFLCCACGDTGGSHVEIALSGVGIAPRTLSVGAAQVTLTRADVSFGPAYFCASDSAEAELCEVALAELRGAAIVHALDPMPQPLGILRGNTGEVRSALYDYGISWLLSEAAPRATSATVDGHSALLEGTIVRAEQTLRFRAALDIAPRARGGNALSAQRTRHELREDDALQLRLDAHAWVDRIDVDALFALDIDGDGNVEIATGTLSYESILQGMISRAPAQFTWGSAN